MKKISARKKKWIERMAANERRYRPYLYSRLWILITLIFAQVALCLCSVYLLVYDSRVGVTLQIGLGIVELIILLYLINKNERSSMRWSWIILILVVPIIGVPSYLLYGDGRPTKRMKRLLEEAKAENEKCFREVCGEGEETSDLRADGIGRYLITYANYPIYTDGEIEYYNAGERAMPVILEELKKAQRFILLDYFIIDYGKFWEEIVKILLEKASLGVQVYVIYDAFGCLTTLRPHYDRYLEGLHENVHCLCFNNVVPFLALRMNNRDHRKIMVIDGKVAFTGGVNLADEYVAQKTRFGYWKDSMIRVKGEAVNAFTKMFFDFWNAFKKEKVPLSSYLLPKKQGGRVALKENSARIQPYDDSPLDEISVGETVYLDIIHRARKYVYIFTPYLILDEGMRMALTMAAMRGVDVRIVVPGIPDKRIVYRLTRANYGALLDAGVKIYEYTPGFLHAKSIVSDDECAVVGTINFDYRSLYHHFENAVYFANCPAVAEVKRDCEETFAVSKEQKKETLKRTSLGRLLDATLRAFETLF